MVKIKDGCQQKEERHRIVHQVTEIGMNKGGGQDTKETFDLPGKYSIIEQIEAIRNFKNLDQPYQEKDDGRGNEAQHEPLVFDIGFFGQRKLIMNKEHRIMNKEEYSSRFITHHSLFDVTYKTR